MNSSPNDKILVVMTKLKAFAYEKSYAAKMTPVFERIENIVVFK